MPYGPTAYFGLHNVVMRHDIQDRATVTQHATRAPARSRLAPSRLTCSRLARNRLARNRLARSRLARNRLARSRLACSQPTHLAIRPPRRPTHVPRAALQAREESSRHVDT